MDTIIAGGIALFTLGWWACGFYTALNLLGRADDAQPDPDRFDDDPRLTEFDRSMRNWTRMIGEIE